MTCFPAKSSKVLLSAFLLTIKLGHNEGGDIIHNKLLAIQQRNPFSRYFLQWDCVDVHKYLYLLHCLNIPITFLSLRSSSLICSLKLLKVSSMPVWIVFRNLDEYAHYLTQSDIKHSCHELCHIAIPCWTPLIHSVLD